MSAEQGKIFFYRVRCLNLLGYIVVEEFECPWNKMKKNDRTVQNLTFQWSISTPNSSVQLTSEQIMNGVKNGTIFGLTCVDIHTPEELKDDPNFQKHYGL